MDWQDNARALAQTIEALYGDVVDYPLLDSARESLGLPAAAHAAAPILSPSEELAGYAAKIRYCTDCGLNIGRRNSVFGRGSPDSPIAFVGDFPSDADDASGVPFSNGAGDLLDKMIVAMKLQPEGTYLTNIFKCRPPVNQPMSDDHFRACEVHLREQFRQLNATIIVTLGETASRALGRTQAPLKVLRGQEFEWEGRRVICTHHPRDLLSSPALKKEAWNDLQVAMRMLGILR
jgi:uracil-DNA glycosylase family 4